MRIKLARDIIWIASGAILWVLGLAGLPENVSTWQKWMKVMLPFIQNPFFVGPALLAGSFLIAWAVSNIRVRWALKEGVENLTPDLPMGDLFYRIADEGDFQPEQETEDVCEAIERDILIRARSGQLLVWGEEYIGGPLAPVPTDHWRNHRISIRSLLKRNFDIDGVHSLNIHVGMANRLTNLYVNRRQTLLIWPSDRRIIRPYSRASQDIKIGDAPMRDDAKWAGWKQVYPGSGLIFKTLDAEHQSLPDTES